jgi:Fe2+ transport system protein FeoA
VKMRRNASTKDETTGRRVRCEGCVHYSLDEANRGDELEIVEVDDEHARIHCLRFGMAEGACVTCVARIPAGPLVLRSGRQEIAVGRNLARRIRVRARHGAQAEGQA